MNTIDIKYDGQIKSFEELFNMAKEQFYNYEKVEGIEDWEAYDFSIDCSEDQMKFKDILQIRFIEELTEASVALSEPNEEHFWEEISDALNFFLSAYVMLGGEFSNLESPSKFLMPFKTEKFKPMNLTSYSVMAYPVIEKVGYLCNLLKNRPWTESNYLVSMYDFNIRLKELWETFWRFMSKLFLTEEDIFEMFYKKFKVNEHRRETNY